MVKKWKMDARNFTVSDLRKEATKQKIKGRSKMNREQLCIALGYGDCGKRALVKKRKPKKEGVKGKKEGVKGKKEGVKGKKEGVKGFDVDAYIKTLPFLNQIKHMDLSKQGIEELRPETFKLLKKLQSLNLSGNRLTSLPPKIFKHNTELQSLNLSGNRLTSLPPNLLENNSKLYQLELY